MKLNKGVRVNRKNKNEAIILREKMENIPNANIFVDDKRYHFDSFLKFHQEITEGKYQNAIHSRTEYMLQIIVAIQLVMFYYAYLISYSESITLWY